MELAPRRFIVTPSTPGATGSARLPAPPVLPVRLPEHPGENRTKLVQSVDRAMLLLRAVAAASPEDSTAPRLAEITGLNRATAWRILHTLEAHGVVNCHRATGRWSVGVAVVDIARSVRADDLIAAARPLLEQLALQTGETAALAVPRSSGLTYVDEVASPGIVSVTWHGRTVPLHATSTGKILLAYGDAADSSTQTRRDLGWKRFTDTTVTDPDVLAVELNDAREHGYAVCRGEYETAAWGVSAPVLDGTHRLVAVLSVWGPSGRVTEQRLAPLGQMVAAAAAAVADV